VVAQVEAVEVGVLAVVAAEHRLEYPRVSEVKEREEKKKLNEKHTWLTSLQAG
jgi:hypothetical protein